jgi:hypothetical protein
MKTKLIAVAAIVAILFALGFRVAHPQDGLQSVMGSAKSSVVLYKKSDTFAVGQKVVVVVAGVGNELGVVKSATNETVDVDTKAAFVRVKQDEVVGKLIAVIPFIGFFFGLVGL